MDARWKGSNLTTRLLAVALMLTAWSAVAQGPATIDDAGSRPALVALDATSIARDVVLITLSLTGPAPDVTSFTIEQPARLAIDLPDTRLALAERFRRINQGRVQSVAAAEAQGRTRVVVEMSELVPYVIKTEGNRVLIELTSAVAASAAQPPRPMTPAGAPVPAAGASAPPQVRTTARREGNVVENIDFRRGEKGEARVLVKLADPSTPVEVDNDGGVIVARFKNATLPDRLARRLDVIDFGTPAKFVDARQQGLHVEVRVTPVEPADFEQAAYQADDRFTLELQPLTAEKIEARRAAEPQFTGERISLSFQSIDVRSLLQIIADVAGANMVISDSVSGDVAMRLQNVPWDQALDIILRTRGLAMRQQGNVMLVAPLEEVAAREQAELESAAQKVQLAPLRTELIQVNYARALDLAALISAGDTSLLSERGRVTVDERTNTMIVLDSRDKLSEVRRLVERLDVPVRQVLIESRIVVASDNFRRDIGARFGVTGVASSGNSGLVTTSGNNVLGTDPIVNSFIANQGFPVTLPGSALNRYNVNLPANPAAGQAGAIGLAILGSDFLIDLELSALQSEGRGEVISTPRVITANGKQALIEQGREIPFQTTEGGNQNASVSFKKAVLSLSVTPQITPDNRILMDLDVTNDTVGENVPVAGGGTAPSIDTRRVTTQVLVRTGDTIVLGGVFEQSNSEGRTKVPLLGDIPLLGALFRSTTRESIKRELLIFVTPRMIQEGLQVN
jgi:type IV pilus assembly protein PilQ